MNYLTFEIEVEGKRTTFTADPDDLHQKIVASVKNQLSTGMNAETPEEAKTKIRVVKTTIKAFLIAAGDILLDFVYGAKNYQKRGKKDDIYEWYINAYVKAALDIALQGKLVMYGEKHGEAIVIHKICPVSLAESIRGTDASEGEGTAHHEQVASATC